MPKNGKPLISKLEKTGFAPILLYLYINKDKSNVTVTEIRDNTKLCSDSLSRTLAYLQSEDFITEKETDNFPFMHILKLTPKGLRVAKPLVEVAAALANTEVQETNSKHP